MSLFATSLLWWFRWSVFDIFNFPSAGLCFAARLVPLRGNITRPGAPASKDARCYSFYPAEWQRQAKYRPINLTWCSSGCWPSISNCSQEAEPGRPQDRSDIRLLTSFRAALWCSYSTWNLNYEVHFRIVVKCWKHNISTCFCQITNSYYCDCNRQEAKDAKTADGKVQALRSFMLLSETCVLHFSSLTFYHEVPLKS